MSSGSASPQPATMPPFMPPPFMHPMITDEQHMPAAFAAFGETTGQVNVAVSVFDPRLEPIPTSGISQIQSGGNDEQQLLANNEREEEEVGETSKRALKACSNCRKDKTKCDGVRPCSNCIKKGFKPIECVDGCVHCRKKRLRCLGGRPCTNCLEAGTECLEERDGDKRTGPPLNRNVNILNFSSTMNNARIDGNNDERQKKRPTLAINFNSSQSTLETVSPLYGTPTSPEQGLTMIQNPDGSMVQVPLYINPQPDSEAGPSDISNYSPLKQVPGPSRSRTGALDRAKTACRTCRRDNKKCSNNRPCDRCVQRGEKCLENVRQPEDPARVKMRCRACRRDNKKCVEMDKRPCLHCIAIGEPCEEVPRKGRGSGSRVKVACMGCRRDKIQCEENRPCKNCLRKSIRCMERICTACNGAGEGDGMGRRCPVCGARPDEGADESMAGKGREINYGDMQHLDSHELIYPNIAPQLQGIQGPSHQHQMVHSHSQGFEHMHMAMMANQPHPQRYPQQSQLPPPDQTQAQAYHQMLAIAHHPAHASTSAQASLNHTPAQTPIHSRPPTPHRNVSSVRFDGDLQQQHHAMLQLAHSQNQNQAQIMNTNPG